MVTLTRRHQKRSRVFILAESVGLYPGLSGDYGTQRVNIHIGNETQAFALSGTSQEMRQMAEALLAMCDRIDAFAEKGEDTQWRRYAQTIE